MTEAMPDRLTRIIHKTSASDVLPKQPVNNQGTEDELPPVSADIPLEVSGNQQTGTDIQYPGTDIQQPVSETQQTEAEAPFPTEHIHLITTFQIEDALNMPPVDWLVENFIAEQTITVVHSEPKVGKSNVFGNLAASIALGREWLGMNTVKCPVLWIDLDMGHIGAMRRMVEIASGLSDKIDNDTFQNLHILTPETFKVCGLERFDFYTRTSVTELQVYIMMNKIKICFIDTLSQIRGASNENDAGDMSKVFETIKTIRDLTGCSFVLIHHSTKPSMNGRQTARGSSVIYAEPDLIVNLSKDDRSDNTELTMTLESARYIEPRKIGLLQSWQPRFDDDDQPIKENGKQLKFYRLEVRDLKEEQKQSTFEQYRKIMDYIRKNPDCSFNQIADAKAETGVANRAKLKTLLDEMTPDYLTVKNGPRSSKLYSTVEPANKEN